MLRSVALLILALTPTGGAACGLPPAIRLHGETDNDYSERSRAFENAQLDEERRRVQASLFDRATRVSLARVLTSGNTGQMHRNTGSPVRRAEAERLGLFKGDNATGARIVLEEKTGAVCDRFASATWARPDEYVIVFEGLRPEETDSYALRLGELREPRIIRQFTEVVLRARQAASVVKP